ncbi:MAG: FtsX-like permease family protein [Bacteroidales bacterium]
MTWRTLRKYKLATFINLTGFTLGLASFIIIYLYISSEFGYDKQWSDTDSIYRVSQTVHSGQNATDYALTSFRVGPSMTDEFPEIEAYTRFTYSQDEMEVSIDEETFVLSGVHYADSGFFQIFDYPLVRGNRNSLLQYPRECVISEKVALNLYGKLDVVDKTFTSNNRLYTVKGVFDNRGYKSHIQPEVLIASSTIPKARRDQMNSDWTYMVNYTYVKFASAASLPQVKEKFQTWYDKYIQPWIDQHELSYKLTYNFENVEDIHYLTSYDFDYRDNVDKKYLYLFTLVAFFVLLIAIVNYINLSTALAAKRAPEVGLRKIHGALRKHLIGQFLSEAFVLSCISVGLALLLTELVLPAFNEQFSQELSFIGPYDTLLGQVGRMGLIVVVVSLLSGFIPALVLSRFHPLGAVQRRVLRFKGVSSRHSASVWVRQGLVVFQFFVSSGLIIATLVITSQMRFMQKQDLGFSKDRIAVLPVSRDTLIQQKIPALKQELGRFNEVANVITTNDLPGFANGRLTFYLQVNEGFEQQMMDYYTVGDGFFEMLQIPAVKGRLFSHEFPGDKESAFVVNQAALSMLGDAPMERRIACGRGVDGHVVGVTDDFHFASLHSSIQPLFFLYNPDRIRYVAVKIKAGQLSDGVKKIKATWQQFFPEEEMRFRFLDENFQTLYQREQNMLGLFLVFASICVLVACFGLLGLTSFVVLQKQKEIGIRKVMGSTIGQLLFRFVGRFLGLVLLANLLVIPIAYWLLNNWLSQFAFRINLSPWLFVLGLLISLFIAFVTVASRAYKAASTNPAEILRYE